MSAAGAGADLPLVRQVVLDCPRPRELAEFYRELLGYAYRPGDEPPAAGEADPLGEDWLVLRADADDPADAVSGRGLAFQQVEDYEPPAWGDGDVDGAAVAGRQRQMLHLDMTVTDEAALVRQRDRVVALGATVLLDRFADPDEPLYVFADPAGHPFCIFVA